MEFDCILKSILDWRAQTPGVRWLLGFLEIYTLLPYIPIPENTDCTLLLTKVKRKGGKVGVIYMKIHVVASRELVIIIANTHRESQIWLKCFYRL